MKPIIRYEFAFNQYSGPSVEMSYLPAGNELCIKQVACGTASFIDFDDVLEMVEEIRRINSELENDIPREPATED